MDINQFKEEYPDFRYLSADIQQKRFDHLENLRLHTIKLLIEERKRIIEEGVNTTYPNMTSKQSNINKLISSEVDENNEKAG